MMASLLLFFSEYKLGCGVPNYELLEHEFKKWLNHNIELNVIEKYINIFKVRLQKIYVGIFIDYHINEKRLKNLIKNLLLLMYLKISILNIIKIYSKNLILV